MKLKKYVLLFALSLACANLHATSVIPPTFDELVGRADVIFQGSVSDVQSQWVGEGAERAIVSYITFKVEDTIKGDVGKTYTIRMLGGTVEGESMEVAEGPRFNIGDKDILFVENNGTQYIPLVGIMHGRFHVRQNAAGAEVITEDNDHPVRSLKKLGHEAETAASDDDGVDLSPTAFKAAIKEKVHAAPGGNHPEQ